MCVSALSAGAHTTTSLVMVDRVKGGGRAPPNLTRLGWFYHHDGMYARKWPLPLCLLCGGEHGQCAQQKRIVSELFVRGLCLGNFMAL